MKLSVQDLYFSYSPRQPLLQDINFTANTGEVTAIIGPNGCGKTTLAKCINRILEVDSGRILLGETSLTESTRAAIGRLIGYVPQSSSAPAVTVIEFLLLGRRQMLKWNLNREDVDAVFEVLGRLDITDLANEQFHQLSGGQRQKVLVARALMQQPALYLFDEPTSALDLHNQLEIMSLSRSISRTENASVLIVLHDLSMALNFADHVIVLNYGRIVDAGAPREIITSELVREVYDVPVTISKDGYVNPFQHLDMPD